MPPLKKATKVPEIPAAFPPAPLSDGEFATFYVQVDDMRDNSLSRVGELKKKLERPNAKILFAGHRGSGKSTELNRLEREIVEDTFVVKFSVVEELDINDINYVDLIMVMMEKLASEAVKEGIITTGSKYINQIKDWLVDVTKIKAEETGYQLEVQAGIKANQGVLSLLIGLIAEFKAAIRASSKSKTEYREELEKRVTILKANCNVLINEIEMGLKKKNKRLLLVVEDMDKADTRRVQEILCKHSGILAELNTRIMFVVSIFALTTPNLADITDRFDRVSLPMIKVREKSGGTFKAGVDTIKSVIERRAEPALFEEGVIGLLIDNCGGVFRDLFEMIEIAANSADFRRQQTISKETAVYAFERLKAKYRGMITVFNEQKGGITTDGLYGKLVEVCKSTTKSHSLDEKMLLLLSCLAVVEYNGVQWFDVHPAVKSLLQDMNLLQDMKKN